MAGLAVFTCHPSSHPFQERRVTLKEPVKIGRSVAKFRPASENGIFDCKVLSRNHALIWYEQESGKFYLQDTKSSNGTFINNQRLSRGSEESPAKEINSGDIIQFGVDVMENSRRGVVTHGCIVAQLMLYNPDGSEASRRSIEATDDEYSPMPALPYGSPQNGNNVPSQELYQLAHYLKEAQHREQMLEQKLATLQRVLASTQEASENSWQALIDEDRLLSRLEVLENQLRAYSKANSEESIRKELVALQEDKHNYETTVKESLKRSLEEKLEACRKLSDTERMLSNSEDECTHIKEQCDNLQKEQEALLEKNTKALEEFKELTQKMAEMESNHQEETEKISKERTLVETKLEDSEKESTRLTARIEEIQAEHDFAKKQLQAMKGKLEEFQKEQGLVEGKENGEEKPLDAEDIEMTSNKEESSQSIGQLKENGSRTKEDDADGETEKTPTTDDEQPMTITNNSPADDLNATTIDDLNATTIPISEEDKVNANFTNGQAIGGIPEHERNGEILEDEMDRYKAQIQESEKRCQETQEKLLQTQSELKAAQLEAIDSIRQINELQEKLKQSDNDMQKAIEDATRQLKAQLESERNNKPSQRIIEDEVTITQTEKQLTAVPDKINLLNTMLPDELGPSLHNHIGENEKDEPIQPSHQQALQASAQVVSVEKRLTEELQEKTKEINILEDKLKEALQRVESYEEELDSVKGELASLEMTESIATAENADLQDKLSEAQEEVQEATERADNLQEQLNKAEASAKEVKDQILQLRDQLLNEQQTSKCKSAEAVQAQQHLAREMENLRKQSTLLQDTQKKLTEATESCRENEHEAEQFRQQLEKLLKQLEQEKEGRSKVEQERKRLETEASIAQKALRDLQKASTGTRHDHTARSRVEEVVMAGSTDNKETEAVHTEKTQDEAAKHAADVNILRQKCTNLEKKMESEINKSRRDTTKLSQELSQLQQLLKESETQREEMAEQEASWKKELMESQKEADATKSNLSQAKSELEELQKQCQNQREETQRLEQETQRLEQQLMQLTLEQRRNPAGNTIPSMKWVPVCVILIAILAAIFQSVYVISTPPV